MTRLGTVLASGMFLGASFAAYAGSLYLGPPTVEDANYVFPVLLGDSDGTVAALDFRLRYDPAVFEPVGTAMGASAAEAGKQVAANTPYPGEHIVVVMGLNQSVMAAGEIARVAMRNLEVPESGETALDIIDPAMSDPNGVEIAARGEGLIVPLGDAPETPEEPTPAPGNGNGGAPVTPPAPSRPATPAAPLARGTAGGVMPDISEGEESEAIPVVTEAQLAEARAALAKLEQTATSEASTAESAAELDQDLAAARPAGHDPESAVPVAGIAPTTQTTAPGVEAPTIESTGDTTPASALAPLPLDAASKGRLPWPLVGVIAIMLAVLGVLAAVRSRLFH